MHGVEMKPRTQIFETGKRKKKSAVTVLFLMYRDIDIVLFYRPALHQTYTPLIPRLHPKHFRNKSYFLIPKYP